MKISIIVLRCFLYFLFLKFNLSYSQQSAEMINFQLSPHYATVELTEIDKISFAQVRYPYVESSWSHRFDNKSSAPYLSKFSRLPVTIDSKIDEVCSLLFNTSSKSVNVWFKSKKISKPAYAVKIIDAAKRIFEVQFKQHEIITEIVCDHASQNDFQATKLFGGNWNRASHLSPQKAKQTIEAWLKQNGRQTPKIMPAGSELPNFLISGIVLDQKTNKPIPKVELSFAINSVIHTFTTDETGHYELILPHDSNSIVIHATPMATAHIAIEENVNVPSPLANIREHHLYLSTPAAPKLAVDNEEPISDIATIYDAFTGEPISGIKISYEIDGITQTMISDTNGNYPLPRLETGESAVIKLNDPSSEFQQQIYEVNADDRLENLKLPMIPRNKLEGKITIVLSYEGANRSISDLDSHLFFVGKEKKAVSDVNFDQKSNQEHHLDVDDTSFGEKPETITIPFKDGKTPFASYIYSVKLYKGDSTKFIKTNATVRVFINGKMTCEVNVKDIKTSALAHESWDVLKLSQNGEVKLLNSLKEEKTPGSQNRNLGGDFGDSRWDEDSRKIVLFQDKVKAFFDNFLYELEYRGLKREDNEKIVEFYDHKVKDFFYFLKNYYGEDEISRLSLHALWEDYEYMFLSYNQQIFHDYKSRKEDLITPYRR